MRLAPEAPAHSTSLRILPLFYSKKALNDEREIPVKSLRHYPFGSEYDCNRADDGSASKNSASKNSASKNLKNGMRRVVQVRKRASSQPSSQRANAHQEACRRQDKNTGAGAPLGVGEDGWVVVPTLAGGSDSSCRPGQFPTADDTPPRAKPARERLGPLKPRKPVAKGLIELSRSMMRSITERDKLLSGEGYVRSALDVRFQPSCRQVSTGESRG
jgi:hypothetical protein